MCRSFESSLEPSLRRVTGPHANLRVAARVYDVEGGAIFAKNSTFVFFDGFAWTPRLRSPSPIMAPAANDDTDEVLNNIAIPSLPKHFLNFLTDNS